MLQRIPDHQEGRVANLITVARLLLLFVAIALIYWGSAGAILFAVLLIAIVFAGDGLDGYVARRRKSTSQFGAVFDIAGDRIVENALWVIFAELQLIPVWIPLLVLTRSFVVDGLRSISYAEGMTAFGERNMMRSQLTEWLTAGRFMRTLYGYAKAFGFLFLTGLEAFGTGWLLIHCFIRRTTGTPCDGPAGPVWWLPWH